MARLEHEVVVDFRETGKMSGRELAELSRHGDSTAFDEIVSRYSKRLYNIVLRYVGNREDALDICQEAFLRAYRSLDSYRGEARVYTWLYTIAVNLARNKLRDGSRKGRNKGTSLEALEEYAPGVAGTATTSARNPGTEAMEHEMEELLQECLDELPEHYRLPFVLRTFEDLAYEEIAEVMDCPAGTVKSRLNQARKLLRERLRERAILGTE